MGVRDSSAKAWRAGYNRAKTPSLTTGLFIFPLSCSLPYVVAFFHFLHSWKLLYTHIPLFPKEVKPWSDILIKSGQSRPSIFMSFGCVSREHWIKTVPHTDLQCCGSHKTTNLQSLGYSFVTTATFLHLNTLTLLSQISIILHPLDIFLRFLTAFQVFWKAVEVSDRPVINNKHSCGVAIHLVFLKLVQQAVLFQAHV